MSKSIKVSEEVYQKLIEIHSGRDTFAQTVAKLLLVREKASELTNIIEGQAAYAEWKLKQLRETPPAH